MLAIKKRYPRRKLYLYGSGALVVGFAGVMTYLVHNNVNVGQFANIPAIVDVSELPQSDSKEEQPQQTAADNQADTTSPENGSGQPAWTQFPSTPLSSSPQQASKQPEAPADSNPETPAQPTETAPTVPADDGEETSDSEDDPTIGDVVDEVVEVILPETPSNP